MNFGKLTDKFLATLPVIGPHAGIEAELLLAKRKPIGGPFLIADDSDPKKMCRSILKASLDRIRLDEAVENGRLSSVDLNSDGLTFRYYCQSDQHEQLKNSLERNQYVFGEEFGYRPRDIRFFEWYIQLPDWLGSVVRSLNAPIQHAFLNTALRDAGIDDPKRHWEELRNRLKVHEATNAVADQPEP
ncbi:MAG: hypothetical protein JNN24_13680 [Hyphomicrobium zavarzinii]|jgi:hypothetical protein|uniref:hypothetical protein n=1 Tax=Hyphomicrobium zavarzinii TaxID=48292 RepID=UPI0012EB58A9|nr:hypothetical protein [Hyphomicrobium zavarzinii]MBL8846814.1 hypothetical protein [Hyphomicrobium zavarzinii]